VRDGDRSWVVDGARLVDATVAGEVGRALPIAPPDAPIEGRPLSRTQVDEALLLAKHFDRRAARLEVDCQGEWRFPIAVTDELPRLDGALADAA
jgi:hypothetical protein